MEGMVTEPVPTTLPKMLPLRLPKKPLASTATLAGPPLAVPIRPSASFKKKSAAPVATKQRGHDQEADQHFTDDPRGYQAAHRPNRY
jgi:hypothetical protein